MTPEQFIAKWQANSRSEAAASKEHFLDLCTLLDVPTPNSDATGATYAFEKGAKKAAGGAGWADVWRRECFGWEYKSRGGDLEAAHDQLLRYAGALENPPLLISSDMDRIVVRTNWTNAVTERHDFLLTDLRNPDVRARLAACWTDPERWRPTTTRQALTEKAAAEFAELAKRLRTRGHAPQAVAHFVNRLVFCLFADDVALLPADVLKDLLKESRRRPADFPVLAKMLFGAMAERDGRIGFKPIQWFDGGLFDDDAALPLAAEDIALLERAAALDWAQIDPSILGTLFERGLDPDKRSQLGAHYTDREKIEKLIDPVIRRPLLDEWQAVKAAIEAALEPARRALDDALDRASQYAELVEEVREIRARLQNRAQLELFPNLKKQKRERSTDLVRKDLREAAEKFRRATRESEDHRSAFLDRLRAFRVLDPACGSGNFLYVALRTLKDLEHQAMVEAEVLGLQPEFRQVGPEAVLGIEINPYAAELARVSVWIGHIQWARQHGLPPPSDPVLRKLDTIECRDAVLDADSTIAEWPKVDVIVGNPPFLGGKRLRNVLGDEYCARLFSAYAGKVPAEADLVCYWVARAQDEIAAGCANRVGLVTTNSIRGGANRRVLEPMAQAGAIFAAWDDEPWTLDGAAVRVSLVCWGRERATAPLLDGVAVPAIHADLTASGADVTTARQLAENAGVAFQGSKKVGPFEVSGTVARQWLMFPTNPNGRPNSDVIAPSWIGIDVARRPRDVWIVDFTGYLQPEAAYFAAPYAHVVAQVKPLRDTNARDTRRCNWWLHGDAQPRMRTAIRPLARFIVTPEVSKHRLFVWAPGQVLPDCKLMVIARDDDTTFGILHSQFHELWSLATGSWHGVGNDPRYTPSTTFETFPFPENLTPNRPAAEYAADPHAKTIAQAARALVQARDHWLNPPELVQIVPEVVAGFPDRILPRDADAAKILKGRTLTALYNLRSTADGAWLDNLHRALDAAVAAAYGWPADLPDDEVLARLLALNSERAKA